jgi:transposase InsO family protein
VEIFALTEKSAKEVVRCLVDEIYLRHGAPRELITDRGTEFSNRIMKEVIRLLGVCRHVRTTPQNPRSDGLAENQMRTLKDMLSAYVNRFQNDWDEHLAVVANAYRTTVNDATGFTPFEMMYGRQASMPDEDHIRQEVPISLYVRNLREALEHTWASVSERVVSNVDRMNQRPSVPLKFIPCKVGDFVMVKRVPHVRYRSKLHEERMKLSQSLQPRYTGPYLIHRVISPVLYEVDMHGRLRVVHALKVKPV